MTFEKKRKLWNQAVRVGLYAASLLTAALLVGLFTTAPMRTAKVQRDADQYRYGRLNLRRRSDMFLHRTVTRSPRNTESSGSGSSGGAHSSSYSSGSHSGRSGKF